MLLLKNPAQWLKKAVIITCAASVLLQSFMPIAQANEISAAATTPSVQLSVLDSLRVFDSKSLGGEDVVFLSSDSPVIQKAMPGLDSAAPMAAQMGSAEGEVVCAVSDGLGMVANFGNRVIQIDSVKTGAVVDGSLTRLATVAHEYGHCLDMLASKSISESVQQAGISIYDVPAVAIANAVDSQNGIIDYHWLVGGQQSAIKESVSHAGDYKDIGISVLEVYADLQGALQTAASTGDYRGFTDFEMAIRLNNLSSVNHTTSLAVAKIFEAEQASGFDPMALQGKSFDAVNKVVNEMFTRHFSKDGHFSIHSDGFKDLINELQLKQELGVDLGQGTRNAVEALSAKTEATPSSADKALYVGMLFKNHDNQTRLISSTSQGIVEGSDVAQLLVNLHDRALKAQETLGVKVPNQNAGIFEKSSVDRSELNSASSDFVQKATSLKSTGLDKGSFKITDFIKAQGLEREGSLSL